MSDRVQAESPVSRRKGDGDKGAARGKGRGRRVGERGQGGKRDRARRRDLRWKEDKDAEDGVVTGARDGQSSEHANRPQTFLHSP